MRSKPVIPMLVVALTSAGTLPFSVTNTFAGTGGKGAGKGVTTTSVGNNSGPTVRDHRGGGRGGSADPNPEGGVTVSKTHRGQHGQK